MTFLGSLRWFAVAALVGGRLLASNVAVAQDAATPKAAPIYLDEPTPVPEPSVAQEGPVNEKYDDGKPRVDRQVRILSDNQVVNHGKYTEYYRNGQKFTEGNFDNGVHEGPWSYWHDNGQLAKTITYKQGAPDGQWEVFRADGTLQSKKGYKAGQRDGSWKIYFEDGKTPKIEQTYTAGKLEGPRKTFFASGKPRQESNFTDGLLDGPMTEWDESGRKVGEAKFEKGMLNGTLVRWAADGSSSEQNYKDNKLVTPGGEATPVPPKAQEQPRLINSAR